MDLEVICHLCYFFFFFLTSGNSAASASATWSSTVGNVLVTVPMFVVVAADNVLVLLLVVVLLLLLVLIVVLLVVVLRLDGPLHSSTSSFGLPNQGIQEENRRTGEPKGSADTRCEELPGSLMVKTYSFFFKFCFKCF